MIDFVNTIKKKFASNVEAKNASWIIGCKIIQMVFALIVSVISARYLGPSNYGLIHYATAYVAFFTALCTLGINGVIIKDFADKPKEIGCAIGTSIFFRAVSSLLSSIMIVAIVFIIDKGEINTIIVCAICSFALVCQVFDTITQWFQYQYKSKVTSIALLVASILTSIYKVVLLVLGKSVYWFAFASSVSYIIDACFLFIAYKKYNGPKLSISIKKGISILQKSYHYILSGMMVAIYGQTDKLMLKQMLTEEEVGYYSIATAVSSMWAFVLQAIIDSIYPTIIRLYNSNNYNAYLRKNKQLYALVFYISMFVSVLFFFLSSFIIRTMYGEAYSSSAQPLRIVTFYTAFSYLGVARNAWLVCENKQYVLKYIYVCAVIINVILNYLMIPLFGASGAALASLITQIFTSIILPMFFKGTRDNARLMFDAIMLKGVF